ncbi:MAG TPA: TniQ family protein [Ferrovibrio sp.]|uniref:TniQ family protein n=1 Tax=Ferrovibrio sp. TaxID=1917215 RepID=UPI002ED409F6
MEIQTLTISDKLHPDESVQGFMARLAQLNGIKHVKWVWSAANLAFRQVQFDDTQIKGLATLAGLDFEQLRLQAPSPLRRKARRTETYVFQVLGHDLPFSCIPTQDSRRVCPECLKLSAHHRLIWNFRFAQVCTDHRIRLVSACPSCKPENPRPLDWVVRDVTICKCGHDLRTVSALDASDDEITGQRYIEDVLFDRKPTVPDLLRGLKLDEVLEVIGLLSDLPSKARWLLLGDSHERFGTFDGRYNLASKEPDPMLGFRLSLGLAICQQPPEHVKAALINAAADEQIWADFDFKRVLQTLRSQMMEWDGKGHEVGRLINDVLASRGIGIPW